MKLEQVTRKDVSYVELQRDKKHSLGFTIKGGTQEEGRPVIKNVSINGPAAKSCAVTTGDVILSVNGVSTAGKKIKDVRRMLNEAGSIVNLRVLYKAHETRILGSCVYRKQRLIQRLQKKKGNFGFLMRKCSKYSFEMKYPVISNIKEGSPIHKNGGLQDGDRLLAIDNVSLAWMSLSYVASLLQAKDEAEFTFEYSVRVINFAEMDTKVDLEMDAPITDLGISFREEYSEIYINSIRQGSAAERCGIFNEGDIVLSINDIDTKNLNVSKANILLKSTKKKRKISFISNRRRYETTKKIIGLSSSENTVTTESFASAIQTSDWKHINTPVNSSSLSAGQSKYNFQNLCYTEQIKSVDKFQNMLSIISSLNRALSSLTSQAFGGTPISLDQNCTSCNKTKHAVKLCTPCLARMNVKCSLSMDVLRELVGHFVRFSLNTFDGSDDVPFNVSLEDVNHMLRETLPNIFRIPDLQGNLAVLAEKMSRADPSCSVCDSEVKTVMMLAKQLQLVLSARDSSDEFTELAEHLVCCLLDVKFPCCVECECNSDSEDSEICNSTFKNRSETVCIKIDEELLSDTTTSYLKINSETESNQISLEDSLNTLHLKADLCRDYLKLTHIQSSSSVSPKNACDSDSESRIQIENRTLPKEIIEQQTPLPCLLSDDLEKTHAKRLFKSLRLPKTWRSSDSRVKLGFTSNIPHLKQSTHSQDDTTTVNRSVCYSENGTNTTIDLDQDAIINQSENTESNKGNQTVSHPLYEKHKASISTGTKHPSTVNQSNRSNQMYRNFQKRANSSNTADFSEESGADFNSESTSSSSSSGVVAEKHNSADKKTYSDTMRLTLKKEGNGGFGLDISDKTIVNEIPVINAIEPKSPSQKAGVLKLGDRILAINGIRTSSLSSRQFSMLKSKAFTANTITLTVEFDVYEERFLFGTFDVVLDRTLMIGFIFEDMKKGSPMVISGIRKGSAAHRCGQLFPGDQVTYFQSRKKEEFDPLTSDYNKEENIIITVLRDPKNVLDFSQKDELSGCRAPNPSPCYVNPSFSPEDSMPQSGQKFDVKKTIVHSSRNNSLVVDHEVTLFRDYLTFDFGILLGVDRSTGLAYVKDIRPDGPAYKSGVIRKLDRILEVNGELVNRNVENSVVELFSRSGDKVDLIVRRVYEEELSEI